MTALHAKRNGFSLIELLVVIAIIAVLMGITGGALFRIRAANQRKTNDATLTKINTLIDSRWKIIRESVNDDIRLKNQTGTAALKAANGDPEVAKTLLFYARIKNELPMTLTEAQYPVTIATNYGSFSLPPRPTFSTLVAGPSQEENSGVCLYAALTSSGSGGTATDIEGLQGQIGTTASSQKVFIDAWGQPIAFIRQAYCPELNSAPYVRAGTTILDPLNPSGKATTILNALAVQPPPFGGRRPWDPVRNFVPSWCPIPPIYDPTVNHVPTVISSGPDKKWGTDIFGGDNQVSFRLRREGNRGD